jgi:hypothetical protein
MYHLLHLARLLRAIPLGTSVPTEQSGTWADGSEPDLELARHPMLDRGPPVPADWTLHGYDFAIWRLNV